MQITPDPGDRVYYTDNGPTDLGTVCCTPDPGKHHVKWDDNSDIDDLYMSSQLTLVRA